MSTTDPGSSPDSSDPSGTPRHRNRRGQGARLRDELVEAAEQVIDRSGDPNQLSIRDVARQAGVSPPAVYLHFSDKDQLRDALLRRQFDRLVETVDTAITGLDDPVQALRAGCRAYLRFAEQHRACYALLFDSTPEQQPADRASATLGQMPGSEAFEQLVSGVRHCQTAGYGRTDGIEPHQDPISVATLIWLGLHGIATLPPARPDFPWPATERLLDSLLGHALGIETADGP